MRSFLTILSWVELVYPANDNAWKEISMARTIVLETGLELSHTDFVDIVGKLCDLQLREPERFNRLVLFSRGISPADEDLPPLRPIVQEIIARAVTVHWTEEGAIVFRMTRDPANRDMLSTPVQRSWGGDGTL